MVDIIIIIPRIINENVYILKRAKFEILKAFLICEHQLIQEVDRVKT